MDGLVDASMGIAAVPGCRLEGGGVRRRRARVCRAGRRSWRGVRPTLRAVRTTGPRRVARPRPWYAEVEDLVQDVFLVAFRRLAHAAHARGLRRFGRGHRQAPGRGLSSPSNRRADEGRRPGRRRAVAGRRSARRPGRHPVAQCLGVPGNAGASPVKGSARARISPGEPGSPSALGLRQPPSRDEAASRQALESKRGRT